MEEIIDILKSFINNIMVRQQDEYISFGNVAREISNLVEKEKKEYLYKFVDFITSVGSILTPEAAEKVRRLCDIVNS